MFEDEDQRVIKPTYAKGSSWLPSIGFTNSLCACFTHMTMGYAPIGVYRQRFFPNLHVGKLKFRLENTSSWSVTSMTSLHSHATSSSTALSTSSQTTLEHSALTMDRDPPRRDS